MIMGTETFHTTKPKYCGDIPKEAEDGSDLGSQIRAWDRVYESTQVVLPEQHDSKHPWKWSRVGVRRSKLSHCASKEVGNFPTGIKASL